MRTETLVAEYVPEFMPPYEEMREGVLYISIKYSVAIHLCACGCREKVVTGINTPEWRKDAWELSFNGGPTLHPSIGNQKFPCRSHYWVKAGRIVWC